MAVNLNLSKSTLIRSLQCQKSLYLYKYYYHLKDPVSKEQQLRFKRGHDIGELAHRLFPGGKDVSPGSHYQYEQSVRATKFLMEQRFHTIYEAAFRYDKVIIFLDILHFNEGQWTAYEVKSSKRISETYLLDAAIQYHIIGQCGVKLNDMSIIHVDPGYELLEGEAPDISRYFTIRSVKAEVLERQKLVIGAISQAQETLSGNMVPDISTGEHCDRPYPCDFKGVCFRGKPLTKR